MRYYCNICKETISAQVYSYSMAHFDRALCIEHQKIARQEITQLADSATKKSEIEPEPKTPFINVISKQVAIQEQQVKEENMLSQWVSQWLSEKHLNISLESKHFFLVGMELEEFARDAIGKAKDEVLTTSPYLDSCHLTTTLQRAVERRVKVKVIARRPSTSKSDAAKAECQANLRKAGVVIHYNNQIHSKIIIIDRKIAIISSMNLYSGSTGGATFEAGIISFEKNVIAAAAKEILQLLEKPESADSNATSTRYWQSRRY